MVIHFQQFDSPAELNAVVRKLRKELGTLESPATLDVNAENRTMRLNTQSRIALEMVAARVGIEKIAA